MRKLLIWNWTLNHKSNFTKVLIEDYRQWMINLDLLLNENFLIRTNFIMIMSNLSISADLTPSASAEIRNWKLSSHLIKRLQDNNITHLFPVQAAVVPLLLKTKTSTARISPGDILCCAPTGSGKTLAYVLPIVDTLISRVIPRIRALVILPTRDLAAQVRHTFDTYIKGSNLKCIVLTGQSSFNQEVKSLFTDYNGDNSEEPVVDILIATPGRLLDHLNNTSGFSLAHLRFLVIDEADRLLNQSYQNWLPNVLASAYGEDEKNTRKVQTRRYIESDFNQNPLLCYTPLQKLLFSATLNQNPAQIAPLKLFNTITISVEDSKSSCPKKRKVEDDDALQMVLPPTLSEYFLVTQENDDKPLACLTLVFKDNISGVIIFTKSVEAAHRLAFIFNEFAKNKGISFKAQAISSDSKKTSRKECIENFKCGKINAIVSSDLLARGMDFGDSVTAVINYDVPTTIQTFTHRVGRCARAGRDGKAYTILEGHQAKWFKSQMESVTRTIGNYPKKIRLNKTQMKEHQIQYREALSELEKSVKKNQGFSQDTSCSKSVSAASSDSDLNSDISEGDFSLQDEECEAELENDTEPKINIDSKDTQSQNSQNLPWWGPGWI
jgi:ATP-dependent RNA helicase DDX51/DBP6